MEEVRCYYRRDDNRDGYELVVRNVRTGLVFRLFGIHIWGNHGFYLAKGRRNINIQTASREFTFSEISDVVRFWGVDIVEHIHPGYEAFHMGGEILNWDNYVRVDGEFWMYLVNVVLTSIANEKSYRLRENGRFNFEHLDVMNLFECYNKMSNFAEYLQGGDKGSSRAITATYFNRMIEGYGRVMGWRG